MNTKDNNITPQKQPNNQNLFDKNMRELHSKELGFGVPENYFSKSKQEILSKVSGKKKQEKPSFFLKKSFVWYAAASIILLITITLVKPDRGLPIDDIQTIVLDTIKQLDVETFDNETDVLSETDILITSLFVEENNIDEFIDNYVLEEALVDEALQY
ncbi:hypothetical protein Q4Q35_06090 [Flavivirga aquimarina]|uniref:DUF4179 domain-containing protein n=1 Tax=Flavivirga aquimarina TaxID=2027862 RepID=A0ABT8W8B6_9FLAO|nr:hypothetical protein [Flavivirga aquimarina]MDO5969370.1 hypothetical protein [Flavivirga aquimarina]